MRACIFASKEKQMAVQQLLWLLRHSLIKQLHTHVCADTTLVRIVAQHQSTHGSASNQGGSTVSLTCVSEASRKETGSSDISALAPSFNASEQQLLADMQARPLFSLLCRLLPYFDGAYNTHHMMWNEGVSHEQLELVLKEFSDVLLVYIC
jgi:hypothetical protein